MAEPADPWIDAINRLLRAEDRPDPWTPGQTKRWNQGDLAQAAGIRPNTLSEILGGHREPSIDTLKKVAAAFRVPMLTLFASEAEAGALRGYWANEDLAAKRTTLAEEVRSLVAEALTPIADRLTAAAVARLTPAEPPATAAATVPEPAPAPVPAEAARKRRRA